jgi:hypothetical protein
MSPFLNWQSFYPQTSFEKLSSTNSLYSKIDPLLPETAAHALTALTSPFYKSHAWPRFAAVPSFSQPAWQFGHASKLCSMDVRLFSWAFFVSGIFPNTCISWKSTICVRSSSILAIVSLWQLRFLMKGILPICPHFQVGGTFTLCKITLFSWIEETLVSLGTKPSALEAGLSCTLFPLWVLS